MANVLLVHTLVLCFVSFPFTLAFTKTVTFDKPYCDEYRIYMQPGDTYEVVWNGEIYPKLCRLRFKMKGIDTYNVCAKVTKFDYECKYPDDGKRYLIFQYGVGLNLKKYRCGQRDPFTYCNEDGVFIQLEPDYRDIESSNSEIRITITSTLLSSYGDDWTSTSSSGSIVGVAVGTSVGILALVIVIIVFACVRSRALQQYNQQCQQHNRMNFVAVPVPMQTSQQLSDGHQVTYYSNDRTQPTAPPIQYHYPEESTGQSSYAHSPGQGSTNSTAPPPSYNEVMSKSKE